MMTLEQIKTAVLNGQTVCWISEIYVVVFSRNQQWGIFCTANANCIGLTHQDGVTMNGEPEDFFIKTPA